MIDVGDAVVHPGFVDLHSHLGYNTLPLWVEPTQTTPYLHHDIWPGEPTLPGRRSAGRRGRCSTGRRRRLLAYVQVRALAGGHDRDPGLALGQPRRRPTGWCAASTTTRRSARPTRSVVSALTLDRAPPWRSGPRACGPVGPSSTTAPRAGPATRVVAEFDDVAGAGCLQPGLVGDPRLRPRRIALRALAATRPPRRRDARRHRRVVTVLQPLAVRHHDRRPGRPGRAAGGEPSGTDWGPSGTKNLLGELKVARLWSDRPAGTSPTTTWCGWSPSVPGDVLASGVADARRPAGAGGAWPTSTVVARRTADVWATW